MTLRYLRYADVADAASGAARPGARILGGGTLLVRDINMGDVSFDTLIRIEDPATTAIDNVPGGAISLGGGVTMARVASEPALAWLAPAALSVGGPAVRAMATVAGNLHAPAPYGDFATALLALDAKVVLHDETALIDLPIQDFLAHRRALHARHPIRAVRFHAPPGHSFRFRKVSRTRVKGLAVMTLAIVLPTDADGLIRGARIACGALAETPVRIAGAEAALEGRSLTPDSIEAAIAASVGEINPVDDAIASAWYRHAVFPVHLRRMLAGDAA